ncbi:hypothetical protein PAPHI01_2045 [Pancytospora philotis]|nr:hypothetical protein PAPHI01_2045 [Pancytospora philotis]
MQVNTSLSKHSILSVYVNTLLHRLAPKRESVISDPKTVKAYEPVDPLNSQAARPAFSFQIMIPGIELLVIKSIPLLSDIDDSPSVIAWLDAFTTLVDTARWDETTAVSILKLVLAPRALALLGQKRTLESCTSALLSHVFPKHHSYKYEEKMFAMRQTDFYKIDEYSTHLRELFRAYCFCSGLKPSEQQAREDSFFMHGLHPSTKIELARCSIYEREAAESLIRSVEEAADNYADELWKPASKAFGLSARPVSASTTAIRPILYCSKHGNCFHSTQQCRAIKARQSPQESKPNDKSTFNNNKFHRSYKAQLVRAPTLQLGGIELTGKITDKEIRFQLDPGAVISCLSHETADKLGLPIIPNDKPLSVQTADGTMIETEGTACLTFTLDRIPGMTFKEKAAVLPGSLSHILLGEPFLISEGVQLDYREATVRIADRILFLDPQTTDFNASPDGQLMARVYNVQAFSSPQSDLTHEQKEMLRAYAEHNPELGAIPNQLMRIELTSDCPFRRLPYSVPIRLQERLKEEIDRLLRLHIITPSVSPYACPAFPILKRNGDIRLIVDYRPLNAITIPDAFPFPNLWEEVSSIPQSRCFSQIDLAMGYHQIMLHPDSRKFTSFVTSFGQYEYTRVPFGLTNAPRVFQRTIKSILEDLPFIRVFLDDILIFSENTNQHLYHLQQVLQRFKDNNVALNFEKSHFFKEEVTYLGLKITHDGIRPDTSHLPTLEKLIPRHSRKEIQKICGIFNWFRPFVPHLSQLSKPLTDKLRKDIPFTWTPTDTQAVQAILQEIQKQHCLSYPDFSKPFNLYTDASDEGIGAVLTQESNILGFFSHKFTLAQSRYTVSEKELLAVIMALTHFRNVVYLSHVNILTDHANLLHNPPPVNNRVQRWKLLLEEYDLHWQYVRGEENNAADALSRYLQVASVATPCLPTSTSSEESPGKHKPIDEAEEKNILLHVHDFLCHPGVETAYQALHRYWDIPNLKKKIRDIRNNCTTCQEYMRNSHHYGFITGSIGTSQPWQDVSSDIYGPVSSSKFEEAAQNDKFYLLTITDRYTRWSEVFKLKTLEPREVISHFRKWIRHNPKPSTCLTDQGRTFISSEFKTFLNEHQITHLTTTAYNPTGNSISERINQTLSKVLQASSHMPIRHVICRINQVLQHQPHRPLRASPFEIRYQYSTFDPLKRKLPGFTPQVAARLQQLASNQNLQTNQKRIPHSYQIGDLVYRRVNRPGKLSPYWTGPYQIIKKGLSNNTFTLENDTHTIEANVKLLRPSREGQNVGV